MNIIREDFKINNYIDKMKLHEVIYLTILAGYLLRRSFDTTLFEFKWPDWYFTGVRFAIIAFIMFKVTINGYKNLKGLFIDCAYLLCIALTFLNTGYGILLELGFLVLGARSVPYKKILKVYLFISIPVILVTITGSLAGAIKDLIYVNESVYKHSFGFNYTTDFGAHVFFAILAYIVLIDGKIGYLEGAAFILISLIMYRFCGTRCSSASIILVVIGVVYVRITNLICKDKKITLKIINVFDWCMILMLPLLAIISFIATMTFSPDNGIMNKVNSIMTGRLKLGQAAIKEYGFSLLGTPFDMIGSGGNSAVKAAYNFVDNSYVMICIRYGTLFFVLTLAGFLWLAFKAKKEKNRYLLLALTVMAIHCVIEHHLVELAYNPLILLSLSVVKSKESSRIKIGREYKKTILISLFGIAILFKMENLFPFMRTFVTITNLKSSNGTLLFLIVVFAAIALFIFILHMTMKLISDLIQGKKNDTIKCILQIITGSFILFIICATSINKMDEKAKEYETTIKKGITILEQISQIDDYKLYVDDIPYYYIKSELKDNVVITGNPYIKSKDKTIVIANISNDLNHLVKSGFYYGKLSDIECIYTNDDRMADFIRGQGIEMTK